MPEYKKQHYVPQHYLRHFAVDDRATVFHIENEEEYPPTPVSNLCYEDYFYDEEGDVEEELSRLESTHAATLHKLAENRSLNCLSQEERMTLLSFVALQLTRTKAAKQDQEELMQSLITELAKTDAEHGGEIDSETVEKLENKEILIEDDGNHAYQMLIAHSQAPLLGDLQGLLLINETEDDFILSDRPIVRDNYKFKDKEERFLGGFQSSGLLLFCPITPELYLLLYDDEWYFINDENNGKIPINSEDVLNDLNKMQLIHAHESIFYENGGQETKMKQLLEEISEHRRENFATFQVSDPDEAPVEAENGGEIVESGHYIPSFNADLQFMRNIWGERERIIRNPALYQVCEERLDQILNTDDD